MEKDEERNKQFVKQIKFDNECCCLIGSRKGLGEHNIRIYPETETKTISFPFPPHSQFSDHEPVTQGGKRIKNKSLELLELNKLFMFLFQHLNNEHFGDGEGYIHFYLFSFFFHARLLVILST